MTTHAILKADIADYMARDDLTSNIPTFIRLCESRIRDQVRSRGMVTTGDLAISSQTTALPDGFLALRRFTIDSSTDRAMEYRPPDTSWRNLNYAVNGSPAVYTIEGDDLVVFPAPGSAITGKLTYLKAYDALSADSDTNWLLANAYDVYLYGCMAEAKSFIEDDEQAAKYLSQFNDACERVNATARRGNYGQPLVRGNNAP